MYLWELISINTYREARVAHSREKHALHHSHSFQELKAMAYLTLILRKSVNILGHSHNNPGLKPATESSCTPPKRL